MTIQKPEPGMLTYNDGRIYEEKCRDVMMYKGPRDGEAVDAETMKRCLDNIKGIKFRK